MADTLLMTTGTPKDVIWVSSSLDDLQRFPDPVKKLMGFALSRPNAAEASSGEAVEGIQGRRRPRGRRGLRREHLSVRSRLRVAQESHRVDADRKEGK